MATNDKYIRRINGLLQRFFGVRVQRPLLIDKHAYRDIAAMRKWQPSDVIFDVGANDGRSVARMVPHLPASQIYAFEPVSSTYEVLTERTRHLSNVHRSQLAMGAVAGEATIYLQPLATMNSFDPGWGEAIGTEVVSVSTVDQEMADRNIPYVHFLKVDTEGFEMEVLKGAAHALENGRIGIIQLEVGLDARVRGGATLHDFQQFLAPYGYFLKGFYNQCRGVRPNDAGLGDGPLAREVLAYCDAVFVCSVPENRSTAVPSIATPECSPVLATAVAEVVPS